MEPYIHSFIHSFIPEAVMRSVIICFTNSNKCEYIVNAGCEFDSRQRQQKTIDLLLSCEQSSDHQMALLSVAMETSNPFLPIAASYQVTRL